MQRRAAAVHACWASQTARAVRTARMATRLLRAQTGAFGFCCSCLVVYRARLFLFPAADTEVERFCARDILIIMSIPGAVHLLLWFKQQTTNKQAAAP